MKNKIITFLFLIMLFLVCSCGSPSESTKSDLVFLGTVQNIEASPLPQSTLNWIVHCHVDHVLSGNFNGKTFSFRVHSPTESELEVGKQYKIRAEKTDSGYTVDQLQWTLNKPDTGDGK